LLSASAIEEVKQQTSRCDSSPNLGAAALGIGSLQIGKPSLFGKKKSANGGGLASKRDLFKNKLLQGGSSKRLNISLSIIYEI
jgi:hypothetical protein